MGSLEALVLANDSPTSPWFCKHVTVGTSGTTASFKVSRWIGAPSPSSVHITKHPFGLDLASQDIDCHTRAADVFEGY